MHALAGAIASLDARPEPELVRCEPVRVEAERVSDIEPADDDTDGQDLQAGFVEPPEITPEQEVLGEAGAVIDTGARVGAREGVDRRLERQHVDAERVVLVVGVLAGRRVDAAAD